MKPNTKGTETHTNNSVLDQQQRTVDAMDGIDTIEEMFAKRALPASAQRDGEMGQSFTTEYQHGQEVTTSD